MQAKFNIERERNAKLFFRSYKNDYCIFQFHSQLEVYFISEGEMEMLVDGKHKMLSAPAVSVALSHVTHAYKTPVASRSSVLLIPANMCEEFLSEVKGQRFVMPYITDPAACEELFDIYTKIKESDGNRVKQLGYIYTLLGRVLDFSELTDANAELDTELATRILFYIDEKFASGISPSDVAQHFGYNQSYISRYFSSNFGTTLSRYLTSIRLRNAVMLMREFKRDVTFSAMESGFSSMRTFYRAFRREFGSSPTEFLKMNF